MPDTTVTVPSRPAPSGSDDMPALGEWHGLPTPHLVVTAEKMAAAEALAAAGLLDLDVHVGECPYGCARVG